MAMTPERWTDVERLFHAALERSPLERPAFLDESCASDAELRREVQSLLDESSLEDGFLEGQALDAATIDIPTQARLTGKRFGGYELKTRSAPAAWVRSTGPAISGSVAKSPSRCCRRFWPTIRIGSPASGVKRRSSATLNHPHIAAI